MEIIVNSHASICLKDERIIYFDPFDIKENKNDADYIFITHDHYDHFDEESIKKVKKETTKIITPLCLKHIKPYKILKPNEIYQEDNFFIVKAIPAYNNEKSYHPKEKEYLGYLISIKGVDYYIMGDTDRTIDTDKTKADVCFIPIGGVYTMDYEEAANYINDLKPKKVIPIHYGRIVGDLNLGELFKEKINKDIDVDLLINKSN